MQFVIGTEQRHMNGVASVITKWLLLTGLMTVFLGCGATHTLIKKRNLDVQTKMSETVFLDPVAPDKRIIYVSIKNTTDKELDIKGKIKAKIEENGYRLTDDPEQATYMLQANVLQLGKTDLRGSQDAMSAGFGGAIAGAAISAAGGGGNQGMLRGGLIGAAAGVIGDALVDDTLYSMITDLQIRERPLKGEIVKQSQTTNARQGTATQLNQEVKGGEINWKTYRTRIVSTANQANLKFEEAQPELENGLIRSIAGMFSD